MGTWTNVDLSLELFVGFDGAWSSHDHSSADLVTLDATDESPHVVASLTAVQFLVEHLCKRLSVSKARMVVPFTNAGDGGLEASSETNDFDFLVLVDDTALRLQKYQQMRRQRGRITYSTSADSTTTSDRENVWKMRCKYRNATV